ncbi:hypothetical protein IFM89_005876 [Coptis chinensis]|uniref:Uncharacterized protein n=1 Tax=Coptis chinensis TaxID=261450 RepID=A0A835HGP4_9MAGN|nr:hypothetical protein IFM89_005876 [Coptis chinensis]
MDAMRIALTVADVDPRCTLFLDDNDRNIAAGKAMGLQTALVGKPLKSKGADYALENIHILKQAIPEIWFGGADVGDHKLIRTRGEINSIIAAAPPVGA